MRCIIKDLSNGHVLGACRNTTMAYRMLPIVARDNYDTPFEPGIYNPWVPQVPSTQEKSEGVTWLWECSEGRLAIVVTSRLG